jgi:long-chain fatty acid transport protein
MRRGGYFGLSFTYRHRKFNAAFSATLPQKWEETKIRSVYRQENSWKQKRDFRFTSSVAIGINYKLNKHNHLVLDLATDDWDQRISPEIGRAWQAGLGYEYRGRSNPFDAYYKKMAYRAGAGYEKLYIHGVDVIRLTGGLGLPLGKRGSKMDLALELGRRGLQNNLNILENYLKLNISLMGTGVWGRPSRRK